MPVYIDTVSLSFLICPAEFYKIGFDAHESRWQNTIRYCNPNYVSEEMSMNNSSGSASLISIKQSKLDMIEYMSDSIKFKIETKYRFFQNYHVKYRYFVLLILTRKTNCYFSWLVIKTPQITLIFKQILISKLPQVPGTSQQAISSHKCFRVVSNHALQNLK